MKYHNAWDDVHYIIFISVCLPQVAGPLWSVACRARPGRAGLGLLWERNSHSHILTLCPSPLPSLWATFDSSFGKFILTAAAAMESKDAGG